VAASGSSRLLRFVQFPSFLRDWQRLRLGDEALRALERELIDSPDKAAVIEQTGGLRKLRFSPPGSDRGKSKRLTVRTYKVPPAPHVCRAGDVKRVRELLGASQAVLAGFLGVNVNTLRSWEQGKRLPQTIARRFLSEIESDPVYWRQRLGQGAVEIEPRNRSDA